MAYEPKEWVCGDTITADDLNRIEEGVAGASNSDVLVVHITAQSDFSTNPPITTYTSDKTYDEINSAYNEGKVIVIESNILSGAIFTKRNDGFDTFYSTPNTVVQKVGVNATIAYMYFTLGSDDSVALIKNSIKVATVSQ